MEHHRIDKTADIKLQERVSLRSAIASYAYAVVRSLKGRFKGLPPHIASANSQFNFDSSLAQQASVKRKDYTLYRSTLAPKNTLASFACPQNHTKLAICSRGRPLVAPRRSRRGATLFATSLGILLGTGILSIFLQSLTRETRQQSALNIVDIIAAHSANLDFWVNEQSATLDPLVTAGSAIVLNGAQVTNLASSQTSTPFYSGIPKDWQFQYLVARPLGETSLFGILVAQPQTAYARTLSDLAQPFVSERIGAAQLGGGTDETVDARGFAAVALPSGIAGEDIALYSFKLNALNPDLVRRRAFSGLNRPTVNTSLDLAGNTATNALAVEANIGTATSVVAQPGTQISTSSLSLPTSSISGIVLDGDASTTALNAQDGSVSALSVQGTSTAQSLNASGKVNIQTMAVTVGAAPSNLYVSGVLTAPSIVSSALVGDALNAAGKAEFQQTDVDRLTLETLSTSTLTVTQGCSGC